MLDKLKAGDRIRLHFVDAPGQARDVTVCAVLSDNEEGFGPEISDYVACWLEVSAGDCADPHARLSIGLGTDYQYSLGGRYLTIERVQDADGGLSR